MASDAVPDGWVRLNVGGKLFVTMKQTLSSSPYFTRLLQDDERMPNAEDGSHVYFVDRDPDRFAKILNYLRDGSLCKCKNDNLEELRTEADFYGLDDLVQKIDELVEVEERRPSMKSVTVSWAVGLPFRSHVSPCDHDHFLLRHLRQKFPCRVGTTSFMFPYGLSFDLTSCASCTHCKSGCCFFTPQRHACSCKVDTLMTILNEALLFLEAHGYAMDREVLDSGHVARSGTQPHGTWTSSWLSGYGHSVRNYGAAISAISSGTWIFVKRIT